MIRSLTRAALPLAVALVLPAAAWGCTVGNVISTCPRQPAKGSVAGANDSSGTGVSTQPYTGVLTTAPVGDAPCAPHGVLSDCPQAPRAGGSIGASDSAFSQTSGGAYSGPPVSVTFPDPAPPPPPPPPSLSGFHLSASVATAYLHQTYTLSWTAAVLSYGTGGITYTPHWSESTGGSGNLAATTARSENDSVDSRPTTITYYVTARADGASEQSNSVSVKIIARPPVYQWENESSACPSGYIGHDTWQEEWEISPTRRDTGNRRDVSDTCRAPPPVYQWESESRGCPAGLFGHDTWQEEWEISPVRRDTGNRRDVSDTCQAPPSLSTFHLSASMSIAYLHQSYTLSWTAPALYNGAGTITYTPHWSETSGASGTHPARTSRTDTTAVNSSLTTVTYYITARADGATSRSNSVSVRIIAQPPPPPPPQCPYGFEISPPVPAYAFGMSSPILVPDEPPDTPIDSATGDTSGTSGTSGGLKPLIFCCSCARL